MTHERWSVGQRREQLLRLGLELFSERPYDEVSVDEIAEAAGISKGLLYHYFSSKREFYVAVVETAVDELIELTEPREEAPPESELRRTLHAYLDYVEQHRLAYLTVMQGGVGADAEVRDLVERMRSRTTERILAGLPVAEPSEALLAGLRGWIGFVEGVVGSWLQGREISREQVVEVAVNALGAVLISLTDWTP